MGNHPQTTLVMHHDLLGFGSMVANAGGRFDSKVGKIAYDRIELLKKNLDASRKNFPENTAFFHFNDTVVALLDINMNMTSDHHGTLGTIEGHKEDYWQIFKFLGASADFHNLVKNTENKQEIGPAGRTVVCLGQRWKLTQDLVKGKNDIGMLSANLAFSEAYEADAQGFRPKGYQDNNANIYINEELLSSLQMVSKISQFILTPEVPEEIKNKYSDFGVFGPKIKSFGNGEFPKYIFVYEDIKNFTFDLFHKKRRFTALDAQKTLQLTNMFDEEFR